MSAISEYALLPFPQQPLSHSTGLVCQGHGIPRVQPSLSGDWDPQSFALTMLSENTGHFLILPTLPIQRPLMGPHIPVSVKHSSLALPMHPSFLPLWDKSQMPTSSSLFIFLFSLFYHPSLTFKDTTHLLVTLHSCQRQLERFGVASIA